MPTLDTRHTLTVTIGGTDVTALLQDGTLSITDVLTEQTDTCEFTLVTDALPAEVVVWHEVVVTDGAAVLFGGYLTSIQRKPWNRLDARAAYVCRCGDYSALLGIGQVTQSFAAHTDKAIIADLFAGLVSSDGFDASTHVSSKGTLGFMQFNGISLRECMQEICKQTGYDWYIDSTKHVWYFAPTTGAASAPFDISDTPNYSTTYPASDIELETDSDDIRNRIYVSGGTYESAPQTQSWTGDGTTQTFTLTTRPLTILKITVNGVVQTFGLDAVDAPASFNCLVNYYALTITWYNAAPATGASIVCTYTVRAGIAVTRTDAASYALYGRYFDYTLINPTLNTVAMAEAAGDVILAAYAYAREKGKFSVLRHGLAPGQMIDITNATLGLSAKEYIIQRVTNKYDSVSGFLAGEVEFGEYQPDLSDWMAQNGGGGGGGGGEPPDGGPEPGIDHDTLVNVTADQHHAGFVGLLGATGTATPDANDWVKVAGAGQIATSGTAGTVTIDGSGLIAVVAASAPGAPFAGQVWVDTSV